MEALQSSFGDAFICLPLLIMGFVFFLGMLTSNIGLLYLFIGHLFIVPALSYLGNQTGNPFFHEQKPDVTKIIKWLLSIGIFFGVNTGSTSIATGSSSTFAILSFIFLAVLQGLTQESYFHFFNPLAWKWKVEDTVSWVGINIPPPASAGAGCSTFPDSDDNYNRPSNWVNHVTFFFGFIMANATAIYNEPTPVNPKTADPDADLKRQAQIDVRVTNRKGITVSIMILSTIIFLGLLFFRYSKTGCEASFKLAIFPLGIAYMTGFAFFTLIYMACGVRPADVLGLVQGMIDTKLIENPIVCVGTP